MICFTIQYIQITQMFTKFFIKHTFYYDHGTSVNDKNTDKLLSNIMIYTCTYKVS